MSEPGRSPQGAGPSARPLGADGRDVLSARDPLPCRPRRVAVAGVSGVGKTTLARRVAATFGTPHVEIDALHHGPNWTPRSAFLDDVRALVARDRWITEWQYQVARPLIAERADLLVWLDLPFWTVTFPRVVRRTLRRRLTREVLWNGNVEPPVRTVFTDREHIVRWAIGTRRRYRTAVPALAAAHPHLTVVQLRSRRQVRRWLAGPLVRASDVGHGAAASGTASNGAWPAASRGSPRRRPAVDLRSMRRPVLD